MPIPRSLVAAAALLLATPAAAALTPQPRALAAPPGGRTVIVQLFQWPWKSVAAECETFLGRKGYGAVQVSPPHEHVVLPDAGDGGHPWWQDYQPVSYDLERLKTRRGDLADFKDMVARCHASGVKIYADAVVNHTTGVSGGQGSAGTRFPDKYTYPGTFSDADFHTCRRPIRDYRNRWEVQDCELENLADLKTESPYVRARLGRYLKDLASLGVDGFRLDASKHMPAADIAAILREMRAHIDADPSYTGTRDPYVYQEVLYGSGEPVRPSEYRGNGDLKEVQAMNFISRKFWSAADPADRIHQLHAFPVGWGDDMEADDKAVVMVDNHDSQRDALPAADGGQDRQILTYKKGAAYRLANVFLLGWDYGTPLVMSSFGFTRRDTSPPRTADGTTTPVTCDGANWICEHRSSETADMVGFRNAVGDTPVNKAADAPEQDWYSDRSEGGPGNKIAFSRGARGYVVINRDETTGWNRTYRTRLPAGRYCNIIGGDHDPAARSCKATHIVTVAADGTFTADVPRMSALALHVGAAVEGPGGAPDTVINVHRDVGWGNRITLRGSTAPLSWSTGHECVNHSAALWRCTVKGVPAGRPFEYKPLINDTRWSLGPNHTATGGQTVDIQPSF
ncbi:alpha-amylase family glycosyl hydrolase [Actinomadura kijaniata]|uniref:alpha-amylase family glycosyl hydrolase n=1 Tax=Actinomadura kijaniata TaxID=46161 RepID=UPI00082B0283|nr:alpha-amylase family glycosyl hydrolase [Actinomadura kijaniata]